MIGLEQAGFLCCVRWSLRWLFRLYSSELNTIAVRYVTHTILHRFKITWHQLLVAVRALKSQRWLIDNRNFSSADMAMIQYGTVGFFVCGVQGCSRVQLLLWSTAHDFLFACASHEINYCTHVENTSLYSSDAGTPPTDEFVLHTLSIHATSIAFFLH